MFDSRTADAAELDRLVLGRSASQFAEDVQARMDDLRRAIAGFWQSRSLATPESDQAGALFGTFSIGPLGYLGIFATMIVIALLTTLTARLTVIRTIYEIDLIRSDPARTDGLPGD